MTDRRDDIQSAWKRAMREGKEESFQYGMDSKFSANLQAIVEQYGDKAVLELGHILKARQADSEVVEEALLQLGMIDDSATQRTRLSILEESLKSDSVGRRDAAGLGIASMNDPSALPALRRALKRETSSRLKHDLHLVVEQLEQTQRCHDS